MPKNILITGAGSGLGRALALHCAQRKARVFIVGRRWAALQATAERFPNNLFAIAADVGLAEGRKKIHSALAGEGIDFLIHNAATVDPIGSLTELDLADFRTALATNLEGPIFLTQALLPKLKPGARILNLSTGLAHRALAGTFSYCVSKAALHMVYLLFKEELGLKGILAGSVMPGVVDTDMQAHLRAQSEAALPDVGRFRSFQEQGTLRSAASVAALLLRFLTETSEALFSEKDWRVDELEKMFS